MIRRRPARVVLAAVALSLLGVWIPLPTAITYAATNCAGGRSNYHDARITTTTNTVGTSAIISTEYPTLCYGASTFSTSWSMIASGTVVGYAQTGYIREKEHNNGDLAGFSQYKRPGASAVTKWFAAPAINSIHSYQSFVDLTGFAVLYIDQYKVDTTNFKPADYWGSQPWSTQLAEETGHCQTDVPGLSSDRVHFTDVRYERPNLTWSTPSGGLTKFRDCGTKYNSSFLADGEFDFWTAVP